MVDMFAARHTAMHLHLIGTRGKAAQHLGRQNCIIDRHAIDDCVIA